MLFGMMVFLFNFAKILVYRSAFKFRKFFFQKRFPFGIIRFLASKMNAHYNSFQDIFNIRGSLFRSFG